MGVEEAEACSAAPAPHAAQTRLAQLSPEGYNRVRSKIYEASDDVVESDGSHPVNPPLAYCTPTFERACSAQSFKRAASVTKSSKDKRINAAATREQFSLGKQMKEGNEKSRKLRANNTCEELCCQIR